MRDIDMFWCGEPERPVQDQAERAQPTQARSELEEAELLLTELLFLIAVRTCPQLSAAQRTAAGSLALNGVSLPRFQGRATDWTEFASALVWEGYLSGDQSNYVVTDKGRKRMGELLMETTELGIGAQIEC